MATVKVDLPNRPEGSVVSVAGLGSYTNGESYNVDEDVADKLVGVYGFTVEGRLTPVVQDTETRIESDDKLEVEE